MTRRAKHPAPWAYDENFNDFVDAAGVAVALNSYTSRDTAERIVRAVNAYESPVAKAERAVTRIAVRARLCAMNHPTPCPARCGAKLYLAVDRLLAARARAKRAGR